MKHIQSILLPVLMLLLISCSSNESDDYCFETRTAEITAVTGPQVTTVLVPLTLQVSFNVDNGCGSFNGFMESNGYPKEVLARVDYEGCQCTQEASVQTQPYTFMAHEAGQYQLKFAKGNGDFIIKLITVTE